MNFYNKFKMAIIISALSHLPIHYNIYLLKYYSLLVCSMCYYEFYNNILFNSNNYILRILPFYWLFFPCIIVNYLSNLKDIWNVVIITVFSDSIQQISNRTSRLFTNRHSKKRRKHRTRKLDFCLEAKSSY